MVSSLPKVVSTVFDQTLLQAMFTLSFYGFLRVGEITSRSKAGLTKSHSRNLIRMSHIQVDKISGILLTMKHFKHHSSHHPIQLQISPQNTPFICHVKAMRTYLKLRGASSDPLFLSRGGSPVSHSFYTSMLTNVLEFCQLDSKRYTLHSFRIGAATCAFEMKVPCSQIQLMGRWRSDAVKRYFRVPVFERMQVSI